MTVKRKKQKKQLHGLISSGILFIGDAQFFAGSPVIEYDAATGTPKDVTPIDPLNPFNTLDRTMSIVGEGEENVELKPHLPGRGVLLNTHLQGGKFLIKKKMSKGKLVGYTLTIIK